MLLDIEARKCSFVNLGLSGTIVSCEARIEMMYHFSFVDWRPALPGFAE
jgi:hypothetical protein